MTSYPNAKATKRSLALPGQRVRIVGIPSWDPSEGAWTITLRVAALHWNHKDIERAVEAVVADVSPKAVGT